MAEYIEREKDKYIKLSQALEVLDSCACWWAHERMERIPAADVRPVVRGKWEEHNYDPEYLSCDFSCSECNLYLEEYYFGEGQWPGKTDHYFCPNCGADMREES